MATKTRKQTTTAKQAADPSEKIISAYMDHVLTEMKQPVSVYAFAKKAGITEKEFYEHFTSFADIDNTIWDQAGEQTINTLASSKEYETYSTREKILGFFYTLQEALNANRSFFIYSMKAHQPLYRNLRGFKTRVEDFSKMVIQQGLAEKELEERKFISDRYHDAVWVNTLFILNFWAKDDSPGFEKTDAAIEKSVNLMMELMGKSALDSMLDLGKFMLQNMMKRN